MSWHNDCGMGYKCTQRDILPLLNDIWDVSYNRIEMNKNATSARGWNPPNRKLLTHPDLTDDVTPPSIINEPTVNSEPPCDIDGVQFTDGAAKKVLD